MIFKSDKMAYDGAAMKYIAPVWELDTEKQIVKHTDETTLEVSEEYFHQLFVGYHLKYVAEHCPEKLQQLVNSGEVIDYLEKLIDEVYDAEEGLVEKWKAADKEYQAAALSGDIREQAAILNRMDMQAHEIVYPELVYTI
ncbi:MAG: hypothetical protein IJ496_06580 [Ruminococcus sp.]|nr:hypothetical protein [Ruminococcus sp.]